MATLLFKNDTGLNFEHILYAEAKHPEIAYELILKETKIPRYNLEFVGFVDLIEVDEIGVPIGSIKFNAQTEDLMSKKQLSVFKEDKWINAICDVDDLKMALIDAVSLMELKGIDDIDWHNLIHAYGPAVDVPFDLKRLTSSKDYERKCALDELFGTIYHQGSIYSATPHSIPFLMLILENPIIPNREEISFLLLSILESADSTLEEMHISLKGTIKKYGKTINLPSDEELIQRDELFKSVRGKFRENSMLLEKLCIDSELKMTKNIQAILKIMKKYPTDNL